MMKKQNVNKQIVEIAESLIQINGYNAFSYRDIAEKVGIKTSSIHYHFPTKADLVKAVIKHHVDILCNHWEGIIGNPTLTCCEKLGAFFDSIFDATYLSDRKMCLGGMLASDVLTLPESIQYEVKLFFKKIEDWLLRLLSLGVKNQEFHLSMDIKLEVAMIMSVLEGSLLLARLYHDESRLLEAKEAILLRLTT